MSDDIPDDLKGKFLQSSQMNILCDTLVRFAIDNKWDIYTLLHWVEVSWLNAQSNTKE